MEKRILIVDDSRLSRIMISAIIKDKFPEWHIVEAASADEALEQANKHSLHAITLDMNMPGRTGIEIVPELKEAQPGATIALLTANIQKKTQTLAAESDIFFIAKPVSEEKVRSFIAGVDAAL